MGASLYQTTEGKVFAEFPVGARRVPVQWPDRASAEAGMDYLMRQAKEGATTAKEINQQARALRLDVPERPFEIRDIDPSLRLDQLIHDELDVPLNDPRRYITGDASVTLGELGQVRAGLRGLGQPGQALAEMFKRREDLSTQMSARWVGELERHLAGLSPDEISRGLYASRELGEVASPGVQAVNDWLSGVMRQVSESALQLGLDVPRLYDPRSYWPHRYDLTMLRDQTKANRIADAWVKSGKATTRDQIGRASCRERV